MKRPLALLLLTAAGVIALPAVERAQGRAAQPAGTKPLVVYVVDTEGGKAALYVSPTGQSLLIDSGNPGARDTDRIMAAVADAGLTRIDYLLSTHYHVDHIGGLQEIAKRIPIGTFVDHGPSVEEREQVAGFQQAYAELYGKAKHLVVKPGDRVPITGLDWRIVTAGGNVLKTALPGGGKPNPACAQFTPQGHHQRSRERAVRRQRGHLRAVPQHRSRRPAVEQGIRADVPEQPDRDRGRVLRVAPRTRSVRLAGARPRRAAARRDHAERHPQGGRRAGDADAADVGGAGGHLAAALGLQGGHRAEQRRRVDRERRWRRDHRRRADSAAARRAVRGAAGRQGRWSATGRRRAGPGATPPAQPCTAAPGAPPAAHPHRPDHSRVPRRRRQALPRRPDGGGRPWRGWTTGRRTRSRRTRRGRPGAGGRARVARARVAAAGAAGGRAHAGVLDQGVGGAGRQLHRLNSRNGFSEDLPRAKR